jgi:hypothetical protein
VVAAVVVVVVVVIVELLLLAVVVFGKILAESRIIKFNKNSSVKIV